MKRTPSLFAARLGAGLCLLTAAPALAVDLKIDINQRAANTPANTEPGFTPMVITSAASGAIPPATANSLTIGAQTVTITGTGTAATGYDDRKRAAPTNSGTFTQQALLQDFIFASYNATSNASAGLDIAVTGLTPGGPYAITIWSFDASSTGTRVSDWSANGLPKVNNYTFSGGTAPTTNTQYQFSFNAVADGTGKIVISGRRDATSVGPSGANDNGVFFNGLWLRDAEDIDADGMADFWETDHGLIVGVNDAALDPDLDNLSNLGEFTAQTDPHNPDTDNDGLLDGTENASGTWVSATNTGTSPLVADSDGDGLGDAVENPDLPWTGPSQPGTNPNMFDTDGDTFSDGEEVNWPSNPRDIAVFPNPQAGATLAVDLENTAAFAQGGFDTLLGPGAATTPVTTSITAGFGPYVVTINAAGSTSLESRDRGTTAAIGGFTPMFRDFIFSQTSDADGDGLDVVVSNLAPLTWYPVTLWSWDPTSAAAPRHSTWLASDGDNAPAVKVPLYILDNVAAIPTGAHQRRMKFDALSDSSGTLIIQGRKEDGFTAATINVFLNGFVIGPPVTPVRFTSLGPIAGTSFPLTWTSDDVAVYRVQASADLTTWQTLNGAVDGLPGTTTFTDTTAGTARRFYMVERVSP